MNEGEHSATEKDWESEKEGGGGKDNAAKQSKRPAQHFECTKKVFHNPIYTHVLAIIG